MADSMAEKCKKLTTSFFSYPKLFTNFTSKVLNEAEALRSPTSILDSKPFFYGFKNPFWSETTNSPETTVGEHKRCCWDNKLDSKGLVDALVDINDDNKHGSEITSKSQSRMILFGSQLKIQIPPSHSPTKSAAELGINIRNNSQLEKSAFESANSALEIETSKSPDRAFSASEMELCEEYTQVISRRPNPRTTHIFDIESTYFYVGCSSSATENVFLPHHQSSYPSQSFLSFCFNCKKNLGHGIDIYMYRGDRAFCSNECRYQGMLLEEGMSELEARDVYGNET